ncbi:MAG: FAD-dependent oxidoreductase, partial [Chloroflexota bacterium]
RFDQWLAGQAVEAGALLIPETVVDDLLWQGRQVVGVRARRPEGEVRCKVVIAADGVNSILAQKAGIRDDWRPDQLGLGVKETLRLPAEVIEERFGVGPGEGVAHLFVGGLPAGMRGGGFLYTNRTSLSLGVVLQLDSVVEGSRPGIEALEAFKAHPAVRRLVKGSTPVEYSAHLVPEDGASNQTRLHTAGLMVVGDAAGLVLNTGVSVEGMHYAIASGIAAGETAVEAIGRGDAGTAALARYRDRLEDGGVLREFRRFRHMPTLLGNPRLHGAYPEAAVAIAESWFTVDGRPRKGLLGTAREALLGRASTKQLLADGIQAWRALV